MKSFATGYFWGSLAMVGGWKLRQILKNPRYQALRQLPHDLKELHKQWKTQVLPTLQELQAELAEHSPELQAAFLELQKVLEELQAQMAEE
ncbi:hypothetical protein HU830_06915 [Lactobacillus sp. DCY120]|uniref:Uncharacterized protein n=1 Tax=Bombilactobacillus apium TaxID=2675299 RepID=A0A850R1A4_9LACO|nr:hypothetical protein [Bombilactobacillus apium]NVY96879.1 hypothetical protein [Bombilactobacillus apium]